MVFEHLGLAVPEPQKMADWYIEHLSFSLILRAGDDESGGAFIVDQSKKFTLELFASPDLEPFDTESFVPMQFHMAYKSADAEQDLKRLVAAGATFVKRCSAPGAADNILLVKDPWGFVIQIVQRADKNLLDPK